MFLLLLETIFIGITLVIIGYIVGIIMKLLYSSSLPDVCKGWNKHYIMEKTLCFIGVVTHLLYEYLGFNKYYVNCKYIKLNNKI